MKILYDYQAFAMQRRGGVSRYFSELVKKLPKEHGILVDISFFYSRNEYVNGTQQSHAKHEKEYSIPNKSLVTITLESIYAVARKMRPALMLYDFLKRSTNKFLAIQKLKAQNFDIFHPTYYDPYFLPYLNGKPFILTIHDMIYELFPEYFGDGGEHARRKKLLAEKAKKIIAVSQNTKEDIVKILGIDPEKITVVYHANFLNTDVMQAVSVPPRYILHVGGRKRWKNFTFLIRALAPILHREEGLSMICAGGEAFDESEQALLKELSINHKVIQIDADDLELVFLYQHAELFVSASLYEGFGIPIVEAFANGCPVAISNASCFPEIAGDAAIYFNPRNEESVVRALNSVLHNPEKRNDLSQKGRSRLKALSLEEMIRKTRDVYQHALTDVS